MCWNLILLEEPLEDKQMVVDKTTELDCESGFCDSFYEVSGWWPDEQCVAGNDE